MYNKASICAEELIIEDGMLLSWLKLAIPEEVTNPKEAICCDPDITSLLNPKLSNCCEPDKAFFINPNPST